MRLVDTRRVTGPGLLLQGPGAVIEAELEPGDDPAAAAAAWERWARRTLDAVGWGSETTRVRAHPGGLSLGITAPFDALYAATELNEWAFAAAADELRGVAPRSLQDASVRLREEIEEETIPRLAALCREAGARGVAFLSDGSAASVGLGRGSLSWALPDLPLPEEVPWEAVHDIPVVMVTGTNGKTTTVRLLSAMAKAGGRVPGSCTTDEVSIAGEVVERGDFAGPMGARRVLRDRHVGLAVLETARGGILRRGLVVGRATAAAVTNVSADHLGEWGVHHLEDLAAAKLVVARVVPATGRVVLNADDAVLAARGGEVAASVTWFTMAEDGAPVRGHLAAGGTACLVRDGALVLAHGAESTVVARLDAVPMAMGGAAPYNVANALCAIGLADALGLPVEAMAAALASFGTGGSNPGRGQVTEVGGLRVLVDFAHNPAAMEGLVRMALSLGSQRTVVALGQAGDRDDDAIRALVRAAARLRPHRVVVKEHPTLLRGRGEGEVPAVFRRALADEGLAVEPEVATDDLDAARRALAGAEAGDLVVLPVYTERARVLGFLETLRESGWTAGAPLPEAEAEGAA